MRPTVNAATTAPNVGEYMQLSQIVAAIDSEITRLRKARALLNVEHSPEVETTRRVKLAPESIGISPGRKKKRNLSPEGRKRISDAVRRRWEEQKKTVSK